jgi:hypothetical protein
MKNSSLLKSYLHTDILDNEAREKVIYLSIPTTVDQKTLQADIKKGARQFQELTGLLEKENEPQYIMISTDNLEQGYMAVPYLAAGFNRKHGVERDDEWDSLLDSADDLSEKWEESQLLIPVITEIDLKVSMGGGNDPFVMGNTFAQFNQNRMVHTPYWMNCIRESVCIVSSSDMNFGFAMGFGNGNSDFAFMDRFCRADGLALKKRKGQPRAMERLMTELVGMEEVKKQVVNIVNVMKYNRIRSSMNLNGGTYHNVHVMLGAPGTAKTTVAQLMGQIMVEEHLLPDDRYTCVNGAELKGMYVGHSAPKTKALFEENDIIVIDEAYSLVGDYGQNDSFSKEALAQLIIELENHSTDKLVIFAGYGGRKVNEKNNKMKDFLDANPGIKSRITSTFYFDSYNAQEMMEIFMRIAKTQKYKVDNSVCPMIAKHFQNRINDDNFGNGREARSLLETSVVFAANRILSEGKKKYTKEEMQTITYEDVAAAIAQTNHAEQVQNVAHGRRIGFN